MFPGRRFAPELPRAGADVPGTYSFTPPDGVTGTVVQAWDGGGAGADRSARLGPGGQDGDVVLGGGGRRRDEGVQDGVEEVVEVAGGGQAQGGEAVQ